MEKVYYSIGEVAKMLNANQSLVRLWSDRFGFMVKPERNAKGNRRYTAKDIEALKNIRYFVKEVGMTLEGAERRLRNNVAGDDMRPEIRKRLCDIREQLQEVLNDNS